MNKFLFHKAPSYRISRHIAFFVVIVLIFTLVLYSRSVDGQFLSLLKLTFFNALVFIGYAYLTIFLLIPLFLTERKFVLFAVSFLLLGFLLSVIKFSISDFLFYSSISPEFSETGSGLSARFVVVNTKDMSFIVALFVVAKFSKDWLIAEKQHHQLLKKYEELNLRLLQSHFEPHFLFNTLNNLYALSTSGSEKTLGVIQKFRRVLRFSIDEVQQKRVPVQKELEMIHNFIEIEQIRYGDRLHIETSITGTYENLEIVPFVLFTLVENCFRHGSSVDAGRPWIKLLFVFGKGKVKFEARNSIPGKCQSEVKIQEKGLAKLRQRLDLVYPRKYTLTVAGDKSEFLVNLELTLNQR